MRQGLGIQSWLNSMDLVPRALSQLTGQVNDSVARGEADILQKRRINAQKRAEETAERRRRQSLGMNIGIGVGGAALGAGLGAALAAPAATTASTIPSSMTMTGGNLVPSLSTASTVAPTTTSMAPAVGGAVGGTAGSLGSQVVGPPSPSVGYTALGADGPMTTFDTPWAPGTPSEFPADFNPGPMPGPHTQARVIPKQSLGATQPSLSANIGTAPTPSYQKFGYLGDNRGQVFGNLFLQGLGGVIPGVGGVAQGINSANQLNYQLGRDTVNDFYRGANLEINKKQLDVQQSRADALQNYYNWKQQNPAGGRSPTDFIQNYEYMKTLDPTLAGQYANTYSGLVARPSATNPIRDLNTAANALKSASDEMILDEGPSAGLQGQIYGGVRSWLDNRNSGSPMSLGSSSPSEPQSVQEYNSMIRSAASEDEAKRLQDIARRRGWIR